MNSIELTTLKLVVFNKKDKEHLKFLKLLLQDKSILQRFQGLANKLLHNYGDDFFDRGFLVANTDKLIGFINIGAYNNLEKSVYLRAAISKFERGNGYGKKLLEEITIYIFTNYPQVESIRLKIASDNKESLATASSCGYTWLEKDYYLKYNPYINHNCSPTSIDFPNHNQK